MYKRLTVHIFEVTERRGPRRAGQEMADPAVGEPPGKSPCGVDRQETKPGVFTDSLRPLGCQSPPGATDPAERTTCHEPSVKRRIH